MRIDVRFFIPVMAFFAPGAMMLIGAFLLGYTLDEARDTVALAGGLFGAVAAICVFMTAFGPYTTPIWWQVWGSK